MPLDFAKTVLQCGSPLPIHQVCSGIAGLLALIRQFSSMHAPAVIGKGADLARAASKRYSEGPMGPGHWCMTKHGTGPGGAFVLWVCICRAMKVERWHACAQVFAQTVREKGAGGLFTGMGPRVTQTALMSAVFFSLFEWWKAQLKRCAPCLFAVHIGLRILAVWLLRSASLCLKAVER